MACKDWGWYCGRCMLSVSESDPDAARLAERVLGLPTARLTRVVAEYRDRLLLDRSRSLLVVLGTACDAQALAGMVILPSEKAEAFERLGVKQLGEFLRRSTYASVPRVER